MFLRGRVRYKVRQPCFEGYPAICTTSCVLPQGIAVNKTRLEMLMLVTLVIVAVRGSGLIVIV